MATNHDSRIKLNPGDVATFNERRQLRIGRDGAGYYTASTASRSRDFGTLTGAHRWLERIDPEGMATGELTIYRGEN